MPSTLADRTPAPGDDRLVLLMTRRATVDWVLGRAAAAEPGVEIRYGVRAVGLTAEPGDPPRVRGVRTDREISPRTWSSTPPAGARRWTAGWLR